MEDNMIDLTSLEVLLYWTYILKSFIWQFHSKSIRYFPQYSLHSDSEIWLSFILV